MRLRSGVGHLSRAAGDEGKRQTHEDMNHAQTMTGSRSTLRDCHSFLRYALATDDDEAACQQGSSDVALGRFEGRYHHPRVMTHLGRAIPANKTWMPIAILTISNVRSRPPSADDVQLAGSNQLRAEGPTRMPKTSARRASER